jgi:hypothetical protein
MVWTRFIYLRRDQRVRGALVNTATKNHRKPPSEPRVGGLRFPQQATVMKRITDGS